MRFDSCDQAKVLKGKRIRSIYNSSVDLQEAFITQHVQPETTAHRRFKINNDNKYNTRTNHRFNITEQKIQPLNNYGKCIVKESIGNAKELMIAADTNTDITYIINEIGSKINGRSSNNNNNDNDNDNYSLIYLKGIKLSAVRLYENKMLLKKACTHLIEAQGSSCKTIIIHNCCFSIAEAVFSSSCSSHFEDVRLIDMIEPTSISINPPLSFNLRKQQQQPLTPLNPSQPELLYCTSIDIKQQIGISSLILYFLTKIICLKKLVLQDCNLQDLHLYQIMNCLCKSHANVESLDLRFNKFTSKGIRSILLIHLRSSLHSLRNISLRQGIRCVVDPQIRDAILHCLQYNQVILESIDIFCWDRSIQHFLDINRAGRRCALCNDDFPRSLWPLLLERATLQVPILSVRQSNILYHMFRNGGPTLLLQQQ